MAFTSPTFNGASGFSDSDKTFIGTYEAAIESTLGWTTTQYSTYMGGTDPSTSWARWAAWAMAWAIYYSVHEG